MPRARLLALSPALAGAIVLSSACGGGSEPPAVGRQVAAVDAAGTWAPSAGCPPVAVPDGDFDLLGDQRACKGGRIVLETNSYPTHLSYYGPERDHNLKVDYAGAMFLPLVRTHPTTLVNIPQIASSWEELEPGKVFVFHLDPDARWSDGKPVTSADVVATWDLIMAPKVAEVVYKSELDRWNKPDVVDERTVRWSARTASWRNLVLLEDIFIMPAHAVDPATYLEAWRWKPPVTSGPYELGAFESGKFFEFVRKKDWWGEGKRQFVGIYNFDSIYRKVISDDDISFEHAKKGDIDFYLVTKAQRWMEETEFDKIQKGWIQKQKMYHREPQAPNQMAFNLTDPVFSDVRVRKGMFWLYNREYLHDQLFYHQYKNKSSYFANSIYENPANEKVTFDPEKGLALLAEAGWSQKDKDGVLVKDGRRFEFDFLYIHPSAERVYTPIQETYRKYGIKMNLKLIQPSAWIKVCDEKQFRMVYSNFGSTSFPKPRDLFHSEFADKPTTANLTHFKDPRVDALIDAYEAESDLAKRAELIRELDGIVYAAFPYLLGWYSDNYRLLWWDKFGMPDWISWPTMDIRYTLWATWWHDEARAKRLEAAMASGTSVPRPPPENTAWKSQ